ncbi:MAG: transglutaminase domain-containing protein, partial [Candidatus Cloacimonetes bacterium]|nr:transglutaminase domain-containing protein [Candidatus Cloacimonadota bacterium]
MKRVAFILILVCLATGLFAFLPSSLSRQGNPVLYDRLMPKAKANIKQVPASHRKEYKKLLKQYDDILMAYLIAYESNATLSSADPDDIFSNYRELRLYLDKEGLHYLPEIFLSYVAKQSVS